MFVNFEHVFISLFSSPLFHFTGSLGEFMFEEMQMVVHGELSIRWFILF